MDDSADPPTLQSHHPNTDINRDAPGLEEPSSSMALRQWLILENIFAHCGAGNDAKSLLGARSVSRIWKSEATTALKKHDHLLPKVVGARLGSMDPSTDLPLKVILISWTPQVDLLMTYVSTIVSIELNFRCPELHIADAIDLNLPQLRYIKLWGCNCTNVHRLDSPELMNGLKLLERLAQAGNVETCEVFMPQRYNNEEYDAASLPMPNQITGLYGVDSRLLDRLTAVREFPRLEKVALKAHHENRFTSEFLNLKLDQLKELSIDGLLELFLSKPLGKLKSLTIGQFCSVGGSEPLPALLPRLSRVALIMTGGGLARNGEVHQNVCDLKLTLEKSINSINWPDIFFQQEIELYGTNLKTTFTRLTNLQLQLNLALVTVNAVSLCPLYPEGLKYLELYGNVNHSEGVDMVKLISGVSLDDILRYESYARVVDMVKLISGFSCDDIGIHKWRSDLVVRQDAIMKLSRLQKLKVSLKNTYGEQRNQNLNDLHRFAYGEERNQNLNVLHRLSYYESEFLFRAAFENMASLKELQFEYCVIENETVKQEWRGSGKLLVEL